MTTRDGVCGIVLAAGSGKRFGGPKQFVRAGGHRLIDLAVGAAASACDDVVLVLPAGVAWAVPKVTRVVQGGATRAESVRRALAVIPPAAAVTVVHQSANPLAPPALFETVIDAVRSGASAAVPGLRPADVVRRVADGCITQEVGRDDLVLVQSPGAFRTDVLRAAYAAGREALDDSALVAALGETITVVPGDPCNVHVTTPQELAMVTCLVAGRRQGEGG